MNGIALLFARGRRGFVYITVGREFRIFGFAEIEAIFALVDCKTAFRTSGRNYGFFEIMCRYRGIVRQVTVFTDLALIKRVPFSRAGGSYYRFFVIMRVTPV